jgi:hypothetical protein
MIIGSLEMTWVDVFIVYHGLGLGPPGNVGIYSVLGGFLAFPGARSSDALNGRAQASGALMEGARAFL